MSDRKPLVLAEGQMQQLQPGDDLTIPLADRVQALEIKLASLAQFLTAQGIELPEELLTN